MVSRLDKRGEGRLDTATEKTATGCNNRIEWPFEQDPKKETIFQGNRREKKRRTARKFASSGRES